MNQNITILKKIGLAVIKDRKLMMVRSHKQPERFATLGGKIDPGEDDITCLKREVKEEVNCELDQDSLQFLQEFEDDVVGRENTRVNIRFYKGGIIGEPIPSSEIAEIKFFDSTIPEKHLTPTSKQIFAWLKENNYID